VQIKDCLAPGIDELGWAVLIYKKDHPCKAIVVVTCKKNALTRAQWWSIS